MSFEQFIQENKNKNEITALQTIYNRPYRQRLTPKPAIVTRRHDNLPMLWFYC